MYLSKVSKQLRREAAANPRKAAVLGLLAAVALWFWAPLVVGWMAPDCGQTETVATALATDVVPALPAKTPANPGTTPKKAESPRYPWQQLVEWINNDLRTLTANFSLENRDPFVTPESQFVDPDPDPMPEPDSQPEKVPPDVTPESLGLVLSSTIIGPRGRVARINGKSYGPGQTVKVSNDGQEIEFTLAEVHPRRVVLSREGKRFELKIPSAIRTGRIEMHGSSD